MNCTGKNCIMQYNKVDPATCPCVPYCPQATPPKTNADKIRQMTDEEMAEWLEYISNALRHGVIISQPWLEWLKEEVKENAN